MKSSKGQPDAEATRERLTVVFVGHVDHGKSTLAGRLLADTQNLPEGKLESILEQCRRNSKPMEYAYLLDALKDEQAQGITVESARFFFKTARRNYLLVDAPGHIEFLKNMVTGAARADAAILVIDAAEGVQENSRRHAYLLSMLGIEQFAVVVNKMDMVDYRQDAFETIRKEYGSFLARIGVNPGHFIAADSRNGCSVARLSEEMPWYDGPTLLEALDLFVPGRQADSLPLRMPVQDVYCFTEMGDRRRIVAGRIESGILRAGDSLLFSPSGKRSAVKTLESAGTASPEAFGPDQAAGFTLDEQIYITRGELVSREGEPPPRVSTRFRADVFWLSSRPFAPGHAYTLKLGTAEVQARLESVARALDAATLNANELATSVRLHEVAECTLRTRRPVAFDVFTDNQKTGRFVLVDQHQIVGGGIIRQALPDEQGALREEASFREKKWIRSEITPAMRERQYGQQAALIVITGHKGSGRKKLAAALERSLFEQGRMVYYLGMGSLVHGLDVDISPKDLGRDRASHEYVRRLGEVLHVLLDAGLIVISTALDLSGRDLKDIETLVAPNRMISVRVGDGDDDEPDIRCDAPADPTLVLPRILALVREGK
ncbi:MAG: Bifunctional enzyme CysN/CysC [Verrucomicrobia bacterium ADurb.Bin345]|nr:MAG: Bifunctional enzyme CysN/CysC [Verrucomicrobia bacterium ADurb.Bin345]